MRRAEILDFGYPQNTETETLKMYITTEGVKSERMMVILHSIGASAVGYKSLNGNVIYRKNPRKSQCKPQARSHGDEQTSSTAKTKPSWTL